MEYFDYQTTAQQAGITEEQLDRLQQMMNREFPHDQMMFELHMLRVCRAIRDGDVSLEEALGVRSRQAA